MMGSKKPRTLTFSQIREGAKRASDIFELWPKWKKEISIKSPPIDLEWNTRHSHWMIKDADNLVRAALIERKFYQQVLLYTGIDKLTDSGWLHIKGYSRQHPTMESALARIEFLVTTGWTDHAIRSVMVS